ncbi:MAG: histidine kinase [Spirochaetales bacterium]|nr:histidine kinase [Spirochaetales bacterium]
MSRSLSLPTKIQITFSLVLIVFLTINTMTSTYYLKKSLTRLLQINYSHILGQTSERIENELRRIDGIALKVFYQQKLIDIMKKAAEEEGDSYFIRNYADARTARTVLHQMIGSDDIPLRLTLFNRQGDYIDFGWQPISPEYVKKQFQSGTMGHLADIMDYHEGGKYLSAPDRDIWYDKDKEDIISVFREFRDLQNHFAYIHIQEKLSVITNHLKTDLPGATFTLIDREGKLIFGEKTGDSNDRQFFILSEYSDYSGWELKLIQDMRYYMSPVRDMQLVTLVVAAALLISGFITILLLTSILTAPLKALHESIYKVDFENLKISISRKDSHQIIKQLDEGFQVMFQRLKDSMAEKLESQDRENQAHMAALQNQMNPHLLFNMLSHINSLASEDETEKIEEICQRLTRSLRYLTRVDNKPVPLQDEINHLQDYLSLMESRYSPLFSFNIEIREGVTRKNSVPKLIFQPLAENAFSHGFENSSPPWKIFVIVDFSNPGYWKASFTDNGSGIEQDKKEIILALLSEDLEAVKDRAMHRSPGGLGLINTITRLRLLYGTDMIFELDSKPGKNRISIGGPHVPDFTD